MSRSAKGWWGVNSIRWDIGPRYVQRGVVQLINIISQRNSMIAGNSHFTTDNVTILWLYKFHVMTTLLSGTTYLVTIFRIFLSPM